MGTTQEENFRPFEKGSLRLPPRFCQYAAGPCDQDFTDVRDAVAFFVFPSKPEAIATTLDLTVKHLKYNRRDGHWRSWRDLPVGGRLIFCEICKSCRFSQSVVADVTTLNFNLLFEIGFAIGLGLPVIPVRDTTYLTNKREFDELGILDTLGYQDFVNSTGLADAVAKCVPGVAVPAPPARIFHETPLYVLKGPIQTDGAVRLMATLKKSALRFRTYDPIETPRLSLFEARRQVSGSIGVVAHLLSPQRQGAVVHNALCALICGMAMAEQKVVLMLQEENAPQPLDYRDVVQAYSAADNIPQILEGSIRLVVQHFQRPAELQARAPEKALEKLDLGDPAAENEIAGLHNYFVPTGHFTLARQGHSRLIVGRKGTGKTAMFYAIRNSAGHSHSTLVLDLKPEGHQFTKLREAVLEGLSDGLQEHTMTAFWNYMLLAEIAHKIVWEEASYAQRDGGRLKRWEAVHGVYSGLGLCEDDDLSQRLLKEVDRVAQNFAEKGVIGPRDNITELVYRGDVATLEKAIASYLKEKDTVWLLIDNLDKSWPTRGTTAMDILIVRALLEAARKLQQQLQAKDVKLQCLVFVRTDVFEHLVAETPDKGKDSPIRLDWDDPEVFEEVVRRRIETSTDLSGSFRDIWPRLFETHISAEDSFRYMLDRTLMRPRDLIQFLQRAIEVAVNRGHTRVKTEDILQAEHSYSDDLLLTTGAEIGDTRPQLREILFEFERAPCTLTRSAVVSYLVKGGIPPEGIDATIELLVWFGFLGVLSPERGEAEYAYEVRYNVRRLLHPMKNGTALFSIHPGFRSALGAKEHGA